MRNAMVLAVKNSPIGPDITCLKNCVNHLKILNLEKLLCFLLFDSKSVNMRLYDR